MGKRRLFVVSDGAVAPTGFGRVAGEVLDRLHDSGEWEIKQLGINYFDQDHDKPYRIFAATAGGNSQDWVGYSRIRGLYNDIKPDATWIFQDFWHLAAYTTLSPEMRGLVTYFPVDSPNIKPQWAISQAAAVEVCTYTRFGAEEMALSVRGAMDKIKKISREKDKTEIRIVNINAGEHTLNVSAKRLNELANPDNYNIVPHGVNTNDFFPMNKDACKRMLGFDDSWFIVGNVNRNQSRKRLDLTILAFAKFAADKPNTRLVLHDPLEGQEGWDLIQLAEYYGVANQVLVSNVIYETDTLNALYNTLDVMVNTSGGEGWGLTNSESACCRVPQIVPNWSATAEIWAGIGILLDTVSIRHEPGRVNTAQCVIDTDQLVAELNTLYADKNLRTEIGEACYTAMTVPQYDWDNIAQLFNEIFHRAADKGFIVPEPLEI